MSRNYYSEINLHITWHTKESARMLTDAVEAMVFATLREKAARLGNVFVHELGATPTHLHLALSVAPTVCPSELVGELKGYSAHETNRRLGYGQKVLQWQAGYGIVSFGSRDLEWVCKYVRNQKEHHAAGTVFDRLEAVAAEDG
jgi:putative transposase